eukprot:349704-Chlamydomonas_euryale.AAC.7
MLCQTLDRSQHCPNCTLPAGCKDPRGAGGRPQWQRHGGRGRAQRRPLTRGLQAAAARGGAARYGDVLAVLRFEVEVNWRWIECSMELAVAIRNKNTVAQRALLKSVCESLFA